METFESISIIYSTYHSQHCLIHYPQCCAIMQRRQSRAHTRVRTHFACHTLSSELRSVTLNYSANKSCRPKQRASPPHAHTQCYQLLKESVMVARYFFVYNHTCYHHTKATFSHAFLYPPSITRCLSIWHFDHTFLYAFRCLSRSLYSPLPSINASVETINKNNDLFKNPQYGSLAN